MGVKIQKILCPVDFSDCSAKALQYAVELAGTLKAELTLLHVVDLQYASAYAASEVPNVLPEFDHIRESAREEIEGMVEECRRKLPGIAVNSLLVEGVPYHEIVEEAEKEEADLVVMGTHGRTGLTHLLIGSVAERVVRNSICPVLTVRHEEES